MSDDGGRRRRETPGWYRRAEWALPRPPAPTSWLVNQCEHHWKPTEEFAHHCVARRRGGHVDERHRTIDPPPLPHSTITPAAPPPTTTIATSARLLRVTFWSYRTLVFKGDITEGCWFPFNKPLAQASLSPSISSHPFLLRSSWFKGTLLLRGKGWEGMEGDILACAKG